MSPLSFSSSSLLIREAWTPLSVLLLLTVYLLQLSVLMMEEEEEEEQERVEVTAEETSLPSAISL